MSKMVERLTRALFDAHQDGFVATFGVERGAVRAQWDADDFARELATELRPLAIAALKEMREPTDAMKRAAEEYFRGPAYAWQGYGCWQKMIDAELA